MSYVEYELRRAAALYRAWETALGGTFTAPDASIGAEVHRAGRQTDGSEAIRHMVGTEQVRAAVDGRGNATAFSAAATAYETEAVSPSMTPQAGKEGGSAFKTVRREPWKTAPDRTADASDPFAIDAEAISERFERDARRYDAPIELY